MAATVSANGEEVATATSDHTAHVIEPDFRWVTPTVAQGLWNEIKSDHIARYMPQRTKFDESLIWTFPVECGAPPLSSPQDGFPGVKNGMLINSYAKAAPGQGSGNVFVEGHQVIRHLDFTRQNAGNSAGIIHNKAETDAARAAFKPVIPGDAADDAKNAKSKSKSTGDGKNDKDKDAGHTDKEDDKSKKEADECTLVGVKTIHKVEGKARGHGPNKSAKATDAWIEVVGKQEIEFEAEVEKNCGKHAEWSGNAKPEPAVGVKTKVATEGLTWTGTSTGGKLGPVKGGFTILGFIANYVNNPTISTVQATGHKGEGAVRGQFSRQIKLFADKKMSGELLVGEGWKSKAEEIAHFLKGKLHCELEVKLLQGKLLAAAEWKHEVDYRAYWEGRIDGTMVVLEISKRFKCSFASWRIPIPVVVAAQAVFEGINATYKFFVGKPLCELYIFIEPKFALEITAGVGMKRYASGGWKPTGVFSGSAALSVTVGLALELMKADSSDPGVFTAEVSVGIEAKLEGKADFAEGVALALWLKKPAVSGLIKVTWDFTRLALFSSGWIARSIHWLGDKGVKGGKEWKVGGDIDFLWNEHKIGELVLIPPAAGGGGEG